MESLICDKCGHEFKKHETVYCIQVIQSVFPDVGSGGIDVDLFGIEASGISCPSTLIFS